ncbi:hypothetical protein B932_1155 [Gluconobacter oxydans H24]|nr:hypothetical protein B932_1155 [Gluconobacter oxydans H24]
MLPFPVAQETRLGLSCRYSRDPSNALREADKTVRRLFEYHIKF